MTFDEDGFVDEVATEKTTTVKRGGKRYTLQGWTSSNSAEALFDLSLTSDNEVVKIKKPKSQRDDGTEQTGAGKMTGPQFAAIIRASALARNGVACRPEVELPQEVTETVEKWVDGEPD